MDVKSRFYRYNYRIEDLRARLLDAGLSVFYWL